MKTAGSETVVLDLTDSRLFGRLTVKFQRQSQTAFLTAPELRELAAECERMATRLEQGERSRIDPETGEPYTISDSVTW